MKSQLVQEKKEKKSDNSTENPMRKVFIEKIILSCGAIEENLQKSKKLLELLTKRKAQIISTQKRIPDFGVRPGLEVGTRVTIRGEEAEVLLKKLLGALENTLSARQISPNHFSFGIKEYIEIPGVEYKREIGIRGLNVTVVFARAGLRVKRKKIKSGSVPLRQSVSPQEIMDIMSSKFSTRFVK